MAKPIPDGNHSVTPYLRIRGAAKAIEFYKKAFGAQEIMRMAMPDGSIMHAQIQIGDAMVMMTEENPAYGSVGPETLKGTSVGIHLYVPDVDATYAQAVEAGAKSVMPPGDMFWGDRFSAITDPFGHAWSIATHKEDLTPEDMAKRQVEAMKTMCGGDKQ